MSAIVEHKNVTDPELHETKGASTATVGHVLTADGLGAASFQPATGGAASLIAAHAAEADPHTGYVQESLFDGLLASYLDRQDFDYTSVVLGSATASVFTDHFSESVPFAHAAKYKIKVPFFWSNNQASTDFLAELRVDGVLIHTTVLVVEPKDAAGADGGTGSGTNQRNSATLEGVFTVPTLGTHVVSLAFAASADTNNPAVYSSQLFVERWI